MKLKIIITILVLIFVSFVGCGTSSMKQENISSSVIGDFKSISEQLETVTPKEEKLNNIPSPKNLRAKWITDRVQLNWDDSINNEGIIGYNVYRSFNKYGFSSLPINSKPIKTAQCSDTNVGIGNSYDYKIKSVDKYGFESESSNIITLEIPIKLIAITDLKAEKEGDSVVLTWTSKLPVLFIVNRNTTELGITEKNTFKDPTPPKERLTYAIIPSKDGEFGPVTEITIDLIEKKKVATSIDLSEKKKAATSQPVIEYQYIGNRATKKFHLSTCSSVNKIKSENMIVFNSRKEAIDYGYIPCLRCDP